MGEAPPPSPPGGLTASLISLLDVTALGDDRFEGRRKQGGVGRVFGGQVIAQALASAELTVSDDRPTHSLHAYFLRGGSEDHPISFHVERDFDGGSFSNRRVVASQQGRPILNLIASFHKPEVGFEHQDLMPEVAALPDSLPSLAWLRERAAEEAGETKSRRSVFPTGIEMRPVDPAQAKDDVASEPRMLTWFRAVERLSDDPKIHRAALAYASDLTLLRTSTNPHREGGWHPTKRMMASLDHAIWFHDDFRADEWLLYATDSPWAGRARGFNRGRIYTGDGRLVAEVAQEGLIRRMG